MQLFGTSMILAQTLCSQAPCYSIHTPLLAHKRPALLKKSNDVNNFTAY